MEKKTGPKGHARSMKKGSKNKKNKKIRIQKKYQKCSYVHCKFNAV